jgi:hypothetical protein
MIVGDRGLKKIAVRAGIAVSLLLAAGLATAHHNDEGTPWGGFSDWHPKATLPVPGALIFGGVAIVAAAATAAHRRRGSKSDAKSGSPSIGESDSRSS